MLCPPGTYNPSTGMTLATDCTKCPANYLCSVYGLSSYTDAILPVVEGGYLSPSGVKYGQELPCPPGTEDESFDLTNPDQCAICPSGSACDAGTAISSLSSYTKLKVKCVPGYYCPSGTVHDK